MKILEMKGKLCSMIKRSSKKPLRNPAKGFILVSILSIKVAISEMQYSNLDMKSFNDWAIQCV